MNDGSSKITKVERTNAKNLTGCLLDEGGVPSEFCEEMVGPMTTEVDKNLQHLIHQKQEQNPHLLINCNQQCTGPLKRQKQ